MSNSDTPLPPVSKTVDQLQRLRESVKDFALREAKLNQAFRLKVHQSEQELGEEEAETLRKIEQKRGDLAEGFENALAHETAKHDSRAAWIVTARRESKQRAMRGIQEGKGHQIYDAQLTLIKAQKQREAALAEAESTIGVETAALVEAKNERVKIGKRAHRRFGGIGDFRKRLNHARRPVSEDEQATAVGTSPEVWISQVTGPVERATGALKDFRGVSGTAFFQAIPVSLLIVLVSGLIAAGLLLFAKLDWPIVVAAAAVPAMAILFGYLVVRSKAKAPANAVCEHLREAAIHFPAVEAAMAERHTGLRAEIETAFEAQKADLSEQSEAVRAAAAEERKARPAKLDAQAERAEATNDRLLAQRIEEIHDERDAYLAHLQAQEDGLRSGLDSANSEKIAGLTAQQEVSWETMAAEWQGDVVPLFSQINTQRGLAANAFPEWTHENWAHWSAPEEFGLELPFGSLRVDLPVFADARTQNESLELPSESVEIPVSLNFPQEGHLLFETDTSAQQEQAIATMNSLLLRLLASAPPGDLSFTIIDPLGLGQNFSGFMHLADYKDSLINGRIWTQHDQIEKRLGELGEHIEKVIQMYLRNDYATITEYNEKAGVIAEKYHFLVIADFPGNLTDTAANRLLSILSSGAKCGVYTMIQWNRKNAPPLEFSVDTLRELSVRVLPASGGALVLEDLEGPGVALELVPAPDPEFAAEFIHRVGEASKDSGRVKVPFDAVTPGEGEMWTLDSATELRVPIGRTGATKLQYLAIGDGTKQHALFAGKTGSGKSTLFHVIVTNLALWHSPDEVEFYLIDFKKGVEFKCYANAKLPHAKVIAIESDRDFGLSVLQRVDDELKRRGDLFRDLGVQDIAGFIKATEGKQPMPRTLLMIDEFQELFTEEDRVAQNASLLLDRLVRQGRAFGIHVLLGSQTLGGAFSLARTTFGQMVIRVALQCNEADAYLIMDDTNPAPRLLTRPGEGIYNDSAGAVEANSPFQVVWLSDEERDAALDAIAVRARSERREDEGPIVFEGNAPASIEENNPLRKQREGFIKPDGITHLWLGAPNSIKGPTEAQLRRQSGNHLLIVGQRDETILGMVAVGVISAASQNPETRIVLADSSAPGTPEYAYLENIADRCEIVRGTAIEPVMAEIAAEQKRRSDDDSLANEAAPIFLFIHGIQKQKKLRYEDDFSFSMDDDDGGAPDPGKVLNDLILEGAALGIHLIVTADGYNNVSRFIARKALSEFEMRVLFQMSANDSGALIDTAQAASLGMNRAIFHNEQEGYSEIFRPYALPSEGWLKGK